jgi:hypothetical protein
MVVHDGGRMAGKGTGPEGVRCAGGKSPSGWCFVLREEIWGCKGRRAGDKNRGGMVWKMEGV